MIEMAITTEKIKVIGIAEDDFDIKDLNWGNITDV